MSDKKHSTPGPQQWPVAEDGVADPEQSLSSSLAWRVSAVLFWAGGAGILLQMATGVLSGHFSRPGVAAGIATFALLIGFLWWALGTRETPTAWLHFGVLLSYAILAATLINLPAAEAQMGVVYLLPLIYVALFLPSHSLYFYVGLSVALIMQASLRHIHDEFGLLPGLMTIVALTSTAGLTLYVRLELNRIEHTAATLSGRDALTGLANLRPLYERIEEAIHEAQRGGRGVTVLMLDLESFKQVNDEYSHSVGDETLRAVARAIADTVRRDELVARRGGDEFAIVTGATDREEIETLIRRVTHNISDARIDMLPEVRSGTTVGYASWVEGDSVGRLLARADRELHEAKARAKIERWSRRKRRLQDIADEIEESE